MKILYFGPIAENGKPAIGGYEAANRKNIDGLRARGIEVIEYRNPTINKKWGLLGKFAYLKLFLYVLVPLKYVGRKDVIAHTTYLHSSFFMLPNAMLSWIMRLCKIKNVLDVASGTWFTRSSIEKKKESHNHNKRHVESTSCYSLFFMASGKSLCTKWIQGIDGM